MTGPNPGEPDAAQPMIDWINGAPPAELAAELMAAFGPDAPRRVPALALSDFSEWMFRGFPPLRGLIRPARPVREALLEAIQLLEHSELAYVRWILENEFQWSATRLGLATLEEGKAAVRQRIRDRTGL
ncbi:MULTISPECIES: hypothetical protein [unclassified Mycobacterium]|uniref:hypothetical protein n=1 Tax=unclassified Mycobacterium TaxID=2642494 RepID=UPI00274211DE|nr:MULTISPECIES: hypothetical protein [unclassified Mycobacterium]MDP7703870.1 hypothetical protein [Mycobacterium sp. TY815]MDP7722352.1 hypothetical protein [Mycobacterium sp. TY814]